MTHPPALSPVFVLAALLAGHTAGTMAVLVLPAVAPAVADDYGIDASLIGYHISLVSVGMLGSLTLLGNASRKLGAGRTNQYGHAFMVAGLAFLLVPWPPLLPVASLTLGVGYGMLTPSASYLLMRYTPADRRNLMFSLHQLGIPLGGVGAALASPAIAVAFGWRWAVVLCGVLVCGVIGLMQRGHHEWDADRDPAAPAVAPNAFHGVKTIWDHRSLRLMSIAGGCFSWSQFCVASYAVVACVEALGMDLVTAGFVLTVVQLSSAGGRVFLGWLVDRVQDVPRVLAWVAGIMLVASLAGLSISPALTLAAAYVLFAVLGAATGSWPGAVLAEVGRLAPRGEVSLAISGSLVITNVGKFMGPILFANAYLVSKNYGVAFATLALPAVVCLWCLIQAARRRD